MRLTVKELKAIVKAAVEAALAERPTKTEYVYLPSPIIPMPYVQPWEQPSNPYPLPMWTTDPITGGDEYLRPSIYKSPSGVSN